jgi:quercetin dioxygenase-like cupin family protein/quinol monooxygenase YgiN
MRKIIILFALVISIMATAQETIFPAKFTAPAEYNTGKVRISVLSRSERQMSTNFLFERGSHNSWHYHPNATQVLMVLNGEAYYQEEGKPKQLLRKGDVVTTAPNVRHWNGATPWSDCECMTVSDLVPGEEHAVQLRKVTDKEFAAPIGHETMIVRLAEIEVYPQHLKEYLAFANEVDRLSVEREPGVVCLFPMQSAEDSTKIRILEIYASEEAYQQHLKTEHFLKYKQGTLHMVKDLKLPTMKPLDPETMKLIFKKQR